MGKGNIPGNLQNGDIYSSAYSLAIEGIVISGFEPDESVGWSAEVYADCLGNDEEGIVKVYGAIFYLCPY